MDDYNAEVGQAWYVATSFEWAVGLRGVAATNELVKAILAVADRTFGSIVATHAYYSLNNVLLVVFLNESAARHWAKSLDCAVAAVVNNPGATNFPLDMSLP